MIHKLPSTLIQQQSFMPDWVKGDIADLPSGLITSIQVTTTSTDDIKLKHISFNKLGLYVAIEQAGSICAYCLVKEDLDIVALSTNNPVLSCTIEIGTLPSAEIDISFDNAKINSKYINVVTTDSGEDNKLYLINNGLETVHELDNDLEISGSSKLDFEFNDGVLIISMSEQNYMDFKKLNNEVIKTTDTITAINGMGSENGTISVTATVNGYKLNVKKLTDNWLEINEPDIELCDVYVDSLDSYIAPSNHSRYMPLDDLYNEDGKRDCKRVKGDYYGGLGGVGEKVGLFEIDTNIDINVDLNPEG